MKLMSSEQLVIDGRPLEHFDGSPITYRFATSWAIALLVLVPSFLAFVFWAAINA